MHQHWFKEQFKDISKNCTLQGNKQSVLRWFAASFKGTHYCDIIIIFNTFDFYWNIKTRIENTDITPNDLDDGSTEQRYPPHDGKSFGVRLRSYKREQGVHLLLCVFEFQLKVEISSIKTLHFVFVEKYN